MRLIELSRLLLFRFIAVFAAYLLIQKALVLFDWWRHGKAEATTGASTDAFNLMR
jgi:hypothetical protein